MELANILLVSGESGLLQLAPQLRDGQRIAESRRAFEFVLKRSLHFASFVANNNSQAFLSSFYSVLFGRSWRSRAAFAIGEHCALGFIVVVFAGSA